MRVEVARSGGFAGRVVRWSVQTDELPAETAAEVRGLLAEAPAWSSEPQGADRFRWRVTASRPDELDVAFSDPGPEHAQRLVRLVREQARPPEQ